MSWGHVELVDRATGKSEGIGGQGCRDHKGLVRARWRGYEGLVDRAVRCIEVTADWMGTGLVTLQSYSRLADNTV